MKLLRKLNLFLSKTCSLPTPVIEGSLLATLMESLLRRLQWDVALLVITLIQQVN